MGDAQFETQPQSKSKRAFHAKVRTGCLICKRRRVRCDERKPYCKGCVRLGHTCEYPRSLVRLEPMPVQLQQTLLPAPVPAWTEADSLRAAYYNAFQRYDPIGLSNSEAFAQVIPRESFCDDIFHLICLSMGSLSLSSVARSLSVHGDQSPISLTTSAPSDAHHAKAVRFYTTALSRLRKRLGSASGAATLSPRILLLSMGAMACFEIMQGNMVASCHLQLGCFSVLSDVVISKAQSGDSERFGLAAMFEDDLAIEEIEAVHVRLAAMCVLASPWLFQRTDRRTILIQRPSLGEFPQLDTSVERFQTAWNSFAQRFESWRLACYWAVCLNGTLAQLPDYIQHQRVLVDCLDSWEKIVRSRARLNRCLPLDHEHLQALKLLLIYVRSMQLFLASEDEDTPKLESLYATDMADLARLPLRPISRFIGGFFFGSWNDFMIDSRLLPMIKFMVLKQQCCTTTINPKLAKLQLDLGEGVWYTMKEYYEGSTTHHDPGFLPVQSRISWTFWWWKHYREVFKTTMNDMTRAES